MIVLCILESDLCFLLELGKLVEILEHQMLDTLLVDFDFDLVLLTEVLQLALLVTQLCLFIFQLFFTNDPEVVDSLTFILV